MFTDRNKVAFPLYWVAALETNNDTPLLAVII